MAAISSAAAGAWSSTGTWAGGVIPGVGDDVTITHAVTLADSRTIGRWGVADTIDLRLNTGGALTVQNGGTLRLRGSCLLNNGWLRIEGGGTLIFDATGAAAPTTTSYYVGFENDTANTRLEVAGTSHALRGVITSDVTGGAARGYLHGERVGLGLFVDLSWARLSHLGRASDNRAIIANGFNGRRMRMQDVVIESTVGITQTQIISFGDIELRRMICDSTARFQLEAGSTPTGTRLIEDCTFEGEFWTSARDLRVRRSFFKSIVLSDTQQQCLEWADNFLLIQSENGGGGMAMLEMVPDGICDRTYMLHASTTSTNPHYVSRGPTSPRRTTIRGWIIESASPTSSPGDMFFVPSAPGYETIYEQCITLPNPAGEASGCFANKGGAFPHTGALLTRHCTLYTAGNLSGLYLDENGTSVAGSVPEVANNICWSRTPTPGSLVYRETGSTATIGIGSGWGHNVFHNVTNFASNENPKLGYNGSTAGPLVTGALSGLTTDLNVNPEFVDDTRNLAKFGRDVGGYSGTDAAVRASVIAALRARPNPADSNYNAAVSIGALLDYIEAGFAPTNPALYSASDAIAGGWRGAVEGVVPGVQLTPDGTVSNTSWTAVGAATIHAALASGDADYIESSTNGAVATVSLTDPVPNLTALTSVVVAIRHRVT